MKGIILLANGFEDMEMITVVDLLRRASIQIEMISIYQQPKVTSQSNVTYVSDNSLCKINFKDYDFVVLPGGKAVHNDLDCQEVREVVMNFYQKKQLIGAICAAPIILGKLGILKNRQYTCYPSCEQEIKDGFYQMNPEVVQDDFVITSRSAGTAIEFSLKIIENLKSKEEAENIKKRIVYLK